MYQMDDVLKQIKWKIVSLNARTGDLPDIVGRRRCPTPTVPSKFDIWKFTEGRNVGVGWGSVDFKSTRGGRNGQFRGKGCLYGTTGGEWRLGEG